MTVGSPAAPRAMAALRWSAWLALAASVAAVGLLIALVLQRLGYPYELEWMEGAMVDEAVRVRSGLATYGPPTLEHVPFLYTPAFYWLSALAMAIAGEGLVAVRLVSVLATVACGWLVFAHVRRAGGDRRHGAVAVGLFCAGYGWLRSWYDLGRSDMVFVAAMLAASLLLRGPSWRHAACGGIAAAAAFLTKQTALFWLPGLCLLALLIDRRRGIVFAATAVAGVLLAVWVADLRTDGWFSFYVFAMPRQHALVADRWLGFWTEDIVPMTPLLVAVAVRVGATWRAGRRGAACGDAAFVGSAVLASWASRLHIGGYDNVLLFGFVAACCVAPAGLQTLRAGRWRALLAVLLGLQFATLAVDVRALWGARPPLLYDPAALLPRAEHRQATAELLAFARAQPGEVWLPFHGHLGALAGRARLAHAQAIYDFVPWADAHGDGDRAVQALGQSIHQRLVPGDFAAIVLEQPHGALFEQVFGSWLGRYERRPGELLSVPTAIQPLVGMVTHSPYALVRR